MKMSNETTNKEQGQGEEFEAFDGELLHPSLDIKNGVLILGFRYRAMSLKEEDIFLVVNGGNIQVISNETFNVEGKLYCIERRGRKMIRIDERWSITDLKKFVKEYTAFKSVPPNGNELFNEIVNLIKRHIELEQDIDYYLLAAWIIGTYFSPIFQAYPFLHVKAPKRSGKSQCLNLLAQLGFNAIKSRPSLPALGDTVDSLRGTYLIDQADSLERKGSEELLDVLADSYKKSGGKRRVVNFDKKRGREVLEFETYGPKAFASIRELPEDLRDRCLVIPLIRSQKNFPDVDESDHSWGEVRAKIYKFLITNYELFNSIYFAKKVEHRQKGEVIGRSLELWLPFLVVFECVGLHEKVAEAWKKFSTQYGFSEYEPSELEEEVIKQLLNRLLDQPELILAPKELAETMPDEVFPSADTFKQRAAKVGWAIKKFNLASEKKPRTKDGYRYLFTKAKVDGIFQSYFKTLTEPTPHAPNDSEAANGAPIDVQEVNVGLPSHTTTYTQNPTPPGSLI